MSIFVTNHVYRNIISSIINSTPDRRVGCRPDDLLAYVKEVFDFDERTHKVIVEEESANKPEYELYVSLIEGRNLTGLGCCHVCPYCVLTVTRKGASSSNTLNVSPHPQRKLSDSLLGLNFSAHGPDATPRLSDAFETQMQHSTCLLGQDPETPRWNEEFHFYVGPDRKQNLIIGVYRSECIGNVPRLASHAPRSPISTHHSTPVIHRKESLTVGALKNVVSALSLKGHNQSCNCKAGEELIGSCSISLKELPVNRIYEKLLPIVRKKSGLTEFVSFSNSAGLIRLKLRLASKTNTYCHDLPEADHVITLDDLSSVIRRFHVHNAMRQHQKYDRVCTYSGDLPDCSDAILEQFLIANNFTRLTRHVINLSVLLEWHKHGSEYSINEQAFQFALERVRCSYTETPNPFGLEFEYPGSPSDTSPTTIVKTPCPYYHIEYLFDRTIPFLNHYLDNTVLDRVPFFPPTAAERGLEAFGKKLNEFCLELCRMELWMWGRSKQPFYHLRFLLIRSIESDTRNWFQTERQDLLELLDQDNAMQYVAKLTRVLDTLNEAHRSYLRVFRAFFAPLEIDYGEVIVPIMDSQISQMALQLLRTFAISVRYVYYDRDMLQTCSRNTGRLYFEMGRFYDVLREANPAIPLQLATYQSWFTDCLDMWLHTTKVSSYDMVMKSAGKDSELEKAAANVNFTASTVDMLAVCKGSCDEFVKLELSDANTLLLATIKMVDIVCDNAIGFSRHLYRNVVSMTSAGKVQISRAANSICHIGHYLSERLPEFLKIRHLFDRLESEFGKESAEYQQARSTLARLASSTRAVTDGLAEELIERILKQIRPEIQKYCLPLTAGAECRSIRKYLKPLQKSILSPNDEAMDSLLRYLEKCLQHLRGGLQAPLFELCLSRIWTMCMECLRGSTPQGQATAYYERLLNHLKLLHQFFDLPNYARSPADSFGPYMATVEMQARSTPDLILAHYANMADMEFSATLDQHRRGRLRVKLAYHRVSGEKMNVMVKIVEGTELVQRVPSEPHCIAEASLAVLLFPQLFYPNLAQRVVVDVDGSRFEPDADHPPIEFVIPESFSYGSTLGMLLISAECSGHSDLSGMAFVHLARIPRMASWKESVEDVPPMELPLFLLDDARQLGSPYQVIKQRRHWDPVAAEFLRHWECILQHRCQPLHNQRVLYRPGGNDRLHQRVASIITRGTEKIKTGAIAKRFSQPKL